MEGGMARLSGWECALVSVSVYFYILHHSIKPTESCPLKRPTAAYIQLAYHYGG